MPVIMKTASWYSKMPDDHVRVGISRSSPRNMMAGYRIFKALAPGAWFNSTSPEDYDQLYRDEVLAKLDPQVTLDKLREMARPYIPVLLCFERPGGVEWCHRALVARWFEETLGIHVPEFGFEAEPTERHPLLPAFLKPA